MQQNIISNFFRPINTDIQIPDSEYAKTDVCIVMADALARNTNHSLYIIDYHRKNFLYVSSNPLFLCGHSPEEVQQKGYAFYFEVVPSDEINRLMEKGLTCLSNITFISTHQKSIRTLSTTN